MKKLKNGKYRVVKINREALWEFIYEQIIDNQGNFFEVDDVTSIVSHFDINWNTGEFICLVRNTYKEDEHLQLPPNINLRKLLKNMNDTTASLYAPNRYVELTIKEIENIISEKNRNPKNKTKDRGDL